MMNKDEAVMKLSKAAGLSMAHAEDLYDSFFEKPVVPQYVADWYEEIKDNFGYDLVEAINSIPTPIDGVYFTDFEKWILDNNESLITLVNMHQFGYEVEKEKRYRVYFKRFASNFRVLKYHLQLKNWFTGNDSKYDHTRMYHTRKELEDADFAWVFDCEGIEIEEVE